ncbi:uncharacterized protein SCHCODRAFT_02502348 [Schizophyllum commune H4-8]|uniref:Uncharacterized protein n=1 Tax=Schizophyllum commune (strain H4-8 / FGSC 9210) TaxID=578458 RepID=D8Q3V1_SCHCM|nr:uncharacterized protein SCHCODRAFT_02502348 [Schizophyllum commune H4-8]KAI5892878.1 hypothetical protein SCHCODRAFT_02502348 [Schizophyllum commune H4-8]
MINVIILSILNGLLYGVGPSVLQVFPLAVVMYIIVFISACHITLHLIPRVPRLLKLLPTHISGAPRTLQPNADATADLRRALAKLEVELKEERRAHSKTKEFQAASQEQLRRASVTIEELKAENQELQTKIQNLETKTQEQEAELVDARDTVTDYPLLAFAARFLQSDVRLLKHENKQLKSQNKTLDTKTKDLRDELLVVKREKRKAEHQLHTRIRTLENDNRALQRGLDSANHYIATNREVDIVERAKLRMQAEEALMQIKANERQMAKREDGLDAVVTAARSSLERELAKRTHIISNLELAVSNHRGYEESLRQRNDDLRQRNRDLRLRHNVLLRKLAIDAVTLSRLTMALKERHEPALSFPSSSNNTVAAQAGVTS